MGEKRPPTELIEGVDYYIENGRWVFTAVHHLKRGYCCDSGCRHCPYRGVHLDREETINPGCADGGQES